MRGKLITLYGINNIGKSTHAKLLVKRLAAKGLKAHYVKYPVYALEPTGPLLNSVLRGGEQKISEDELQLWFVLNRYQYQPELERLLAEGYIVVAEDYIGTGLAWGEAKGLDREWLEAMNKHLLREDFAIWMDGVRSVSARESGHVHEENDELVERCAKVHKELADKYGWERIEVQPQKEETANLIWKFVHNRLG